MEYIFISIFILITLIIIKSMFNIKIKEIRKIVKEKNEKLEQIEKKLPTNIEICKTILKQLGNTNTKIEEDENSNTSLYIAVTNKIIIGKIQNKYMAVQTIAHECIHSIQPRNIQLFNFLFSNIYYLYFIIISILTIFNVIKNGAVQICILTILGTIWYFVRSYLEQDAMTKAKYVAKQYLEENQILEKEEQKELIKEYEKVNNIGIKFTNYILLCKALIKVLIYAIICLI